MDKPSSPAVPLQQFLTFATATDAWNYRAQHGTGGWIFAPDAGHAIIFPPDMTPTPILAHPLCKGRTGQLIGCARLDANGKMETLDAMKERLRFDQQTADERVRESMRRAAEAPLPLNIAKQYRYYCGCGCGSITETFSKRKALSKRERGCEITDLWAVREGSRVIADCYTEEHAQRVMNALAMQERIKTNFGESPFAYQPPVGFVSFPAKRVRAEPCKVRQTGCRYCDQDIEGMHPYRKGEWRDRGNNTTCPSGPHEGKPHAPYIEKR